MFAGCPGAIRISSRALWITPPLRPACHVRRERRLFLQGADAGPERRFQMQGMRLEQGFGRIGVADAASKLRRLVIGGSPEDAMALRTGDPTRYSRSVASSDDALYPARPASGVRGDQASDIRHGRHVLRMTDLDRVTRHLWKEGLLGILHDGRPAVLANHAKAHASVVQGAGENHADDPLLVRTRCTAKKRIDGRAMSILLRSAAEHDASGLDQKMQIGWRDIDTATQNRL